MGFRVIKKTQEDDETPTPGSTGEPVSGSPPPAERPSLRLSDRPPAPSSASLLSLANAFATQSDDASKDSHSSSGPPPSSRRLTARGAHSDSAPGGAPARAKLVEQMRDKLSVGDYTGALAMAEGLETDETYGVEARRCAEVCRSVLEKMYIARIGPLDRVPHVNVPREQLRWLSIDHRAGFVLSHVDGVSSFEMILDVSGMPTLDVLRILHRLVQERVITIR